MSRLKKYDKLWVRIVFRCESCGKKNRWRWRMYDVFAVCNASMPMECEHCGYSTQDMVVTSMKMKKWSWRKLS